MQAVVDQIRASLSLIRENSKRLLGIVAIVAIVVGLPLSLIASQSEQINQQHAASDEKITLPDGGKIVFTIHVNGLTPGNPAVFYITSSSTHTEPTKGQEPTKPPKIEPTVSTDHKEASGGTRDSKNPTQVKGIETAQSNDGGNETVHHSEPTMPPKDSSGDTHSTDSNEPTGIPETKDFIPSQVYTTDDNGDIVLSVNPSDHLVITPLVSKGYTSISPSSLTVYILQAQCGISTPCLFIAVANPTDQHTGPTPTTCIPRPLCLDATPRCLTAEPVQGWCPAPSHSPSPEPTITAEKKCPQLASQCHYIGSGMCIPSTLSNTCSCGEIVCSGL